MLKFDNGLVISMIGMYIENIFVDNKYSILASKYNKHLYCYNFTITFNKKAIFKC